ncbi:alpha/beta fold hydrolase [Pseudonocardia acidicola]|uniref:Alpha/beta fold hydrolase n=1 Tax=Pseudonocardia acidicola TaxID=2724939 RepID=A0ABX1SBU0_9PSEU|nr:alpha/beta fold hydrolase [Pseudonocardia acidicola]NMH99041.1 alpha/beta fold hydrolase [Pseudonocardia acidicola]
MVTVRPDAPDPGSRPGLHRVAALMPDPKPDPSAVLSGGIRGLVEAAVRVAGSVPAVAGAATRLAAELGKVAVGQSEVEPARGDRRFSDPTWTENPGYHRLMQAYLATCAAIDEAVADADLPDWRDRERARFLATVLASALAPTNTLFGNPAALKRALETGGGSLRRGIGNLFSDLRHNGGLPRQVDRGRFVVGRDLAATPGAVVYRDDVLELLQYRPQTAQVRKVPVVVVPPQINKYYFMDLAPGRSLIEYAVSKGQQVFAISWRNPVKDHRDWDLDTYGRAILSALDAVAAITRSEQVNLFGLCAGGITTATVLNHLAATGNERVRSASFGVTLLDWSAPAPIGMMSAGPLLRLADWRSRSAGVLDGRSLASVFTWMRPNDLVWNYWVNNYLLGTDPPPFDILAWNADTTNLPSGLHRQFLEIFEKNTLTKRGALTVLGAPIDLKQVTVDTYVTGGTSDHLTPWNGCYASAALLGGTSTFVLTNTGHIQTLVCPPGNKKSKYWTGPEPGTDPEAWRKRATEHAGTWWEHWAGWIGERSGPKKAAPDGPGDREHPPLADAPGTYVHTQA